MNRVIACFCLIFMLLTAACGGTSIDWDSRLGVYTLENATDDYGDFTSAQDLGGGDTMYIWEPGGGHGGWLDRMVLVFDANNVLKTVEHEGDM